MVEKLGFICSDFQVKIWFNFLVNAEGKQQRDKGSSSQSYSFPPMAMGWRWWTSVIITGLKLCELLQFDWFNCLLRRFGWRLWTRWRLWTWSEVNLGVFKSYWLRAGAGWFRKSATFSENKTKITPKISSNTLNILILV